jgi:hypothetical protein
MFRCNRHCQKTYGKIAFKCTELIYNALLFADEQFIISDTEDNLQQAVYLLRRISKEYNLEIATKKDQGWDRPPKNRNHYKR